MRHGTLSGYNKHACRCVECSAAMRAQSASYYERNRDRLLANHRARRLKQGPKPRVGDPRPRRRDDEMTKASQKVYRQRVAPYRKAAANERVRGIQGATRAAASARPWQPYCPEEDSMVVRADLTLEQIAYALGRSYHSVKDRRRKLRLT